jgi:DNA/RNA-binding domain of Phe-tRNA-synthetase-like protein
MDDTKQAVSFLESSSANPDLQNAFNAAYASLQTAKTENTGAKNALAQSLSPDQSLALIKQSLDSLSETYQGFFAVSKAINAILPK